MLSWELKKDKKERKKKPVIFEAVVQGMCRLERGKRSIIAFVGVKGKEKKALDE